MTKMKNPNNALFLMSAVGSKRISGILHSAWNDLYRKSNKKQRQYTCGIDGETINDIKQHEIEVLSKISQQLRSDTGYVFSLLKPIKRPKTNGKFRIICIPTVRDRIVQKAIQKLIEEKNLSYTQFNGINFGFISHKGVKDAIEQALILRDAHKYVYKTDISAFFDTIPREDLKKVFRQKIKYPSLFKLVDLAIDTEILIEDSATLRDIKSAGIVLGKGVRQGMPLSPLFANLYLNNLDKKILKMGIPCVRYADDLIFYADNVEKCIAIDKFVRKELEKINLDIPQLGSNNSKTKIYNPDQVVEFLGMGIVEKEGKYVSIITDRQKDEIKNSIFKYCDMQYLNANNITLSKLLYKLQAMINGYIGVYKDCFESAEFDNTLRQWVFTALHKIIKQNYNIDINSIDKKLRKFLIFEIDDFFNTKIRK